MVLAELKEKFWSKQEFSLAKSLRPFGNLLRLFTKTFCLGRSCTTKFRVGHQVSKRLQFSFKRLHN